MKLEAYIAERTAELRAFEAYWRENQAEDADDWPEHMGEGEWFEQELAYLEMVCGREV